MTRHVAVSRLFYPGFLMDPLPVTDWAINIKVSKMGVL